MRFPQSPAIAVRATANSALVLAITLVACFGGTTILADLAQGHLHLTPRGTNTRILLVAVFGALLALSVAVGMMGRALSRRMDNPRYLVGISVLCAAAAAAVSAAGVGVLRVTGGTTWLYASLAGSLTIAVLLAYSAWSYAFFCKTEAQLNDPVAFRSAVIRYLIQGSAAFAIFLALALAGGAAAAFVMRTVTGPGEQSSWPITISSYLVIAVLALVVAGVGFRQAGDPVVGGMRDKLVTTLSAAAGGVSLVALGGLLVTQGSFVDYLFGVGAVVFAAVLAMVPISYRRLAREAQPEASPSANPAAREFAKSTNDKTWHPTTLLWDPTSAQDVSSESERSSIKDRM